MNKTQILSLSLGAYGALSLAMHASSADLQVIYSEVARSSTSDVPGARDLAGLPASAKFLSISGLSVRVDADEWVVRGTTDQGSDLANILIRGFGTKGCMFLQEGQPLEGGGDAGEVWDFFDTIPVGFNSAGMIAYSARARGGTITDDNEKIGTFNGTAHTIVMQQGDAVSGLPNNPPSQVCTSPAIGNSVGPVRPLTTGEVFFGVTPIENCSSFFYPALFKNTVGWILTGPTPTLTGQPILAGAVGEECIADAPGPTSSNTVDVSEDGQHFLWEVTTNHPSTAVNGVLLLDFNVLIREGGPVATGSAINMVDIFQASLASNGDWYARGDDASDNDWAVRNDVVIAATGTPIITGATELWGNAIGNFVGNGIGDYILSGNTNNADPNADNVLVFNGDQVIAREGDPVDVNGNGSFDDNAFINGFTGFHASITDNRILYFLCTLRNGAGTLIGDAFIRADLDPLDDCPADITGDGTVNVTDLLQVISAWGRCPPACPAICAPDINGDNVVNVTDLLEVISAWGDCP